ncbi:MAG TPA: hypothetical protein O0X23_02950 [Methanocorpusculum sp.]|nr:hypothetical protein [Methanocorpusculum sp.]
MKKITYFLIILLLCAAFAGAGSAESDSLQQDIDPSEKQIEDVGKKIDELGTQVTKLSELGADASKLGEARKYLMAANDHKSTDIATASKQIECARTAMVNAALAKSECNLNTIGQNIADLKEKGWDDPSLSDSQREALSRYELAKAAYADSASSTTALVLSLEALNYSASTLEKLEKSKTLWEKSQKSPPDAVSPYAMYIVIGVVVVLVLVGVIVAIRHRKENDWDELG